MRDKGDGGKVDDTIWPDRCQHCPDRFGLSQIGGLRPKNFDEEYDNLYYVGASTTPGAGLPMAVISAEMVCRRILKC